MYWKLGDHENMIVLLGLNHVKQALRKVQMADSFFCLTRQSELTYIRSAAVVNLRIVAHPLEVGSKGGSIVIKRDSLMHRD